MKEGQNDRVTAKMSIALYVRVRTRALDPTSKPWQRAKRLFAVTFVPALPFGHVHHLHSVHHTVPTLSCCSQKGVARNGTAGAGASALTAEVL